MCLVSLLLIMISFIISFQQSNDLAFSFFYQHFNSSAEQQVSIKIYFLWKHFLFLINLEYFSLSIFGDYWVGLYYSLNNSKMVNFIFLILILFIKTFILMDANYFSLFEVFLIQIFWGVYHQILLLIVYTLSTSDRVFFNFDPNLILYFNFQFKLTFVLQLFYHISILTLYSSVL